MTDKLIIVDGQYQVYESRLKHNATCEKCGKDNDLLVAFTKHKVCLACSKQNYLKATGQKKKGKK